MRLEIYCLCGSGMEGEIDPKGVDKFKSAWFSEHSGDGHRDCSMSEAVQAYREQNNGEMPMGHDNEETR